MKHKITYKRVFITDCSDTNRDFQDLFNIFAPTLKPGMRFIEFKKYYYSEKLKYIDVTFILADGFTVGFCAAAFYSTTISDKNYVIGRAATGILQTHRGNKLPKWKLYKKYIQYWLRNPFSNIILTAYVANPLIYAMICKYTGIAYPRRDSDPPEDIVNLKDDLLRSQNLDRKEERPFVVEIHFPVKIDENDKERIFTSQDESVKYYLKINPKFMQQYGVIVIIPVNLKNILYSSFRFLYHNCIKIILFHQFVFSLGNVSS